MGILKRAAAVAWCAVATACIAPYSDVAAPLAPGGASDVALQRIVDSVVSASGIPGAVVAVANVGGPTRTFASGTDNVAVNAPMRVQDRFRVGAVERTMVAAVTLQLVDEHALSLDDTIAKWLPGIVPNAGAITVRELLNQTSGVHDYINDPGLDSAAFADPSHAYTPADLIAVANRYAPYFAPGAAGMWVTSSTNFVLLGMVVEKVTGISIAAQLQARLFNRLGMPSTSVATTPDTPAPFSRGYRLSSGAPVDVTQAISPTVLGAGGAVVSNSADMVTWVQALASGSLLSPARQADLLNVVPASGTQGYGLGVQTFEHWVGHYSYVLGYEAQVFARPGVGTIVVLTNKNTSVPTASSVLFDAVRWAAFGSQ